MSREPQAATAAKHRTIPSMRVSGARSGSGQDADDIGSLGCLLGNVGRDLGPHPRFHFRFAPERAERGHYARRG